MIGRQRQMTLAVLDDRDRETLGEVGERRHRGEVAAGIGGDDQRLLRPCQDLRRGGNQLASDLRMARDGRLGKPAS